MTFQDKLQESSLPKTYKRNNIKCFLDEYRQKLIQITPEEIVRQKVAFYLERELGIPHDLILIEEPLSHYGVKSKDRADIIINKYDSNENILKPLAVVECKAETVMIVDKTCEQAKRYADALECNYFFVTNGFDIDAFKYVEEENIYLHLSEIPTYSQMLKNKYTPTPPIDLPPRVPFDLLSDKNIISEYVNGLDIGRDTPFNYIPFVINLLECFLDTSHSISLYKCSNYEIIEDYGLRLLTYGNAGGGVFSGPYRSIIIKDNAGNHQFISFGFSSYSRTEVDNSKEKTALCIAIDDFDKTHHALQLVLDDHLIANDYGYTIWHSGRIAVGNRGSGKISKLKELILNRCPELMEEDKIVLGKLNSRKLLYVDDNEVEEFIHNLILYALVRDEYRGIVKNKKLIYKKQDV